jgi:hypothetical protein
MGNIGAEIGQALGLALKKASSMGSGILESYTSIQPYTRDEYACIMAFCNVQQARDIPKIWRHFVSTKAKQIKIHRRVIQSLMSKWAYNHCTKIDTFFFLTKNNRGHHQSSIQPKQQRCHILVRQVRRFDPRMLPKGTC